jgi:fido (protein-threonine AMPylation protein)
VSFSQPTTEERLRNWREGQVSAERLAADLLRLAGFVDVEPQAPLGGPDDRKDILCVRGGRTYVGAAYFPAGDKTPGAIRQKFKHDLEGVVRHSRHGIVFITNQAISQADREQLLLIAEGEKKLCEILHRESIRVLLDSPSGYGIRLSHLRISMTPEEQFAYFSEERNGLALTLERHIEAINRLSSRVDLVLAGQQEVGRTLMLVAGRLSAGPESQSAAGRGILLGPLGQEPGARPTTAVLTTETLQMIHRLALSDLPSSLVGQLRTVQVWIGAAAGAEDEQVKAPSPAEVPALLDDLLNRWSADYWTLLDSAAEVKRLALADFHARLLRIHPFADGNGRVARELLAQQALDLFGAFDPSRLDRGAQYYQALKEADRGNKGPLAALIGRAIPASAPQLNDGLG